jgi:hypothetical protein
MRTDLYHTLEAGTHVAVRSAALPQTVDTEPALAVRDQAGGYRLPSIRLHSRSFEREIAALAAMSTLGNP